VTGVQTCALPILIEFKNNLPKEVILYSKDWEATDENYLQDVWDADQQERNDTEWFLEELIWSFKYFAGEIELESEKLLETIREELNLHQLSLLEAAEAIANHPEHDRYMNLVKEEIQRARNGTELFGKNFIKLWY
jgi:hypothetical protein